MKLMKRKGRIRTVYVLLKCAMAGYIFPTAFVIYYIMHRISAYEVGDLGIYTDSLYLILTMLGILWLAGILVTGTEYIISCLQMRSYRMSRYLPLVEEQELLRQVKSQLGIRRKVRLYHGYQVRSPFSTNFLRPVIYLAPREYDSEELRVILTHELYHIKYWDIFWKPVFHLFGCIYWFHPLVKYVQLQYRRWTEANCDNHCYADHFGEKEYFQVIMHTVLENEHHVNMLASNWCENKHDVVWRMELMQESGEKQWKTELSVLAIILVIIVSLVVTWTMEYGMSELYSMIVDRTQNTLIKPIQHSGVGNEQDELNTMKLFRDIPVASWVEQATVENEETKYILGQIELHSISADEVIRAETFEGISGDSVTLAIHIVSGDSRIEMGIMNSSGEILSLQTKDTLMDNLIIPDDGEYAVFICNLGTEPVEIHGSYTITPTELDP